MTGTHWIVCLLGFATGMFCPPFWQLGILIALSFGYASCYKMGWPRYQRALAYLIGGLSTGWGMQAMALSDTRGHSLLALLVGPLIWLLTRMVFMVLEARYSLAPGRDINIVPGSLIPLHAVHMDGSCDAQGQAPLPDAHGHMLRFQYWETGEIRFGPPFGDVLFSNGFAFTHVAAQIVMARDGRYVLLDDMTHGGFLLLDCEQKRLYRTRYGYPLTIDRIEDDALVSEVRHQTTRLPIQEAIAQAKEIPLVQAQGWSGQDEAFLASIPGRPAAFFPA